MAIEHVLTPDLNLADPDLFGNDAAEEEKQEVLASYFVEKRSFAHFYRDDRRLAIVRARKGMGKSALLAKIDHDIGQRDEGAFTVKAHGADIVALANLSSSDPLTLIANWQQAICRLINLELARRIKFAVSDSAMLMVEAAELAQYKERNFVSALLDRVRIKGAPIELAKAESKDAYRLLKAYSANSGTLNAWLLIDDIDSTFLNTADARLRISTFFSALRKLAAEFRGLTIRVSVRTDVWTSIARSDEAMDKCEQYVLDLSWSKVEFRRIHCKKILAYLQRHHPTSAPASWSVAADSERLLAIVFPKTYLWNHHSEPADVLIHSWSHGRPRWAAQLCRLAGHVASNQGKSRILMPHMRAVLSDFGKLRLDDLHREHQHQFDGIQGLTEAFAGGKHSYHTHELLTRIWDRFVTRTGGAAQLPLLHGGEVKGALELAHFLYRIGFLSAVDVLPNGHKRRLTYEDRPDLLSNTVNPDGGMSWEIHNSYRGHLKIRQDRPERRAQP